jgi:hypothetical protein
MPHLKRYKARLVGVAAVIGGVAVSAALVWQASYSAFSATTANPTNNWTAGTVALTDDDSNAALFTVSPMKPTQTGTKCIVVTSSGNLASTVKMYTTAASFAQTKTVADNMTLTVTQGTSTSTGGNCAGWVADAGGTNTFTGSLTSFSSTYTNFGNGFGTWAPAAGTVTHTYQITWTFNSSAPNSAQAGTAAIGFTWELQNS